MTFWERAAVLLLLAAWVPVAVGAFARAVVFRRDQYQAAGPPTETQKSLHEDFEIPNQEPDPGDPNYVPFDDEPTRPMSPGSAP